MSIWKYASVPQRERVKMIRNGNSDVFNEEIKLSQNLYDVRKDFGLDTTEIEEYKNYITSAYNKGKKENDPQTKNTPVFYDAVTDNAINNFYEKAIAYSNSYVAQKEKARDMAKTSQDVLEEWIAANGHSKDGKLYREKSLEIQNELDEQLKKIKAEYDKNIESTRQVLQKALLRN